MATSVIVLCEKCGCRVRVSQWVADDYAKTGKKFLCGECGKETADAPPA